MTKTAFIAIIGKPNVGKSSILNKVLGQKIAIVSDKPQTTRTRIIGVLTRGETQLVFTDTPGFHKPKTKLGEKMIKAVGLKTRKSLKIKDFKISVKFWLHQSDVTLRIVKLLTSFTVM